MKNNIMQSLIYMLLMMSTIIFSQLKHPLSMGFILLIQTAAISFVTGMMTQSFWFSYILFLVFLGGMLVLFIYVTSLASNEMFHFSFKLMITTLVCILMFMIIILIMDNMEFTFMNNQELDNNSNNSFSMLNPDMMKSIYKLYNFSTNWMTCLMINYLLFTLIVVVKITNFFYGPLRNLN